MIFTIPFFLIFQIQQILLVLFKRFPFFYFRIFKDDTSIESVFVSFEKRIVVFTSTLISITWSKKCRNKIRLIRTVHFLYFINSFVKIKLTPTVCASSPDIITDINSFVWLSLIKVFFEHLISPPIIRVERICKIIENFIFLIDLILILDSS